MGRGGARPGNGRKPIAEEQKTRELCRAAITGKYGTVQDGIQSLLESGKETLIKFVFEHAIGKPTDKVDMKHSIQEGQKFKIGDQIIEF